MAIVQTNRRHGHLSTAFVCDVRLAAVDGFNDDRAAQNNKKLAQPSVQRSAKVPHKIQIAPHRNI